MKKETKAFNEGKNEKSQQEELKSAIEDKAEKGQKISVILDKEQLASLIDSIKSDLDFHNQAAAEIEERIEKLANAALNELLRVLQLKKVLENLAGQESPSAIQATDLEGQPAQRRNASLEVRIKKLQTIKKLLRYSLKSSGQAAKKKDVFSSPPPGLTPRKKVLVVDDDPTTVKIISHLLEKENFSVITSHDGAEGLKKAFQERPDLILLDIMMPDLNGFQFLSIFQKNETEARTPVILLSSLSEEADILIGLETGAVDYIVKPFSPPVLLAKIKKHLNLG